MSFSFFKTLFRKTPPPAQAPAPHTSPNGMDGAPQTTDDENTIYESGVACAKSGDFRRALELFDAVLTRNPQHYLALTGIGNAYYLCGDYRNAVEGYRRAFELQPHSPNLLINYSNALRFLGDPASALPLAKEATRLSVDNPDYLTNLALIYQDLGQFDESKMYFDEALRQSPSHLDARLHLGVMNLLRGKFDIGWPDYELRLEKNDPPVRRTTFPRWLGQPIANGALLIYAEQGVGDEIMFASCFGDALQRVEKCVLQCSPKLTALFRRSFPGAHVVGGDQSADLDSIAYPVNIACAIPTGSLPLLFRKNISDFPQHDGYLKADPQRIAFWKSRLNELGPGLRVGISWFGGTPKTRGHLRSTALRDWTPLLTKPGVHFISLQHRASPQELDSYHAETKQRVHYYAGIGDDLEETAAVIENLDLVVSVQNTAVHLAGSLGRRTWALVPVCPEWRYLAYGESMPWYPAVRIFRQTRVAHWQNVFETVADELDTLR